MPPHDPPRPEAEQAQEQEPEPTELHVCHRCLVRLDASAGGVDLPRRLRQTLAARGLANRTRVISSGCLGYCPRGRVSVLVLPEGDGEGVAVRLIDPEKDGEDLAEYLLRGPTPVEPP